jgi:hypothetical protein
MKGLRGACRAMLLMALIPTAATPSSRLTALPEPTWAKPGLSRHAPYTIHGRLTLIDKNLSRSGSSCAGQGDEADIRAGAPVTVTDASGRVLGRGPLGAGRPGEAGQGVCHFEFEIDGVPEVAVYRIGLERRGALQYSLVQMKLQNWLVQLQLRG